MNLFRIPRRRKFFRSIFFRSYQGYSRGITVTLLLTIFFIWYLHSTSGDNSVTQPHEAQQSFFTSQDQWLALSSDIQVYSAHLEANKSIDNKTRVLIPALITSRESDVNGRIICTLTYNVRNRRDVVTAVVVQPSNFDESSEVASVFLACYSDGNLMLTAVDLRLVGSKTVHAIYLRPASPAQAELSVGKSDTTVRACVRPMPENHIVITASRLAEFVAFYRNFGVDRFTFYNATFTDRAAKLFVDLREQGVVYLESLSWNGEGVRKSRTAGLVSLIGDCALRHPEDAYVLSATVSSFLMPRSPTETIQNLLLTGVFQKKLLYRFARATFCTNNQNKPSRYPLIIQRTLRKKKIVECDLCLDFMVRSYSYDKVAEKLKQTEDYYDIEKVGTQRLVMHHYSDSVCYSNVQYDSSALIFVRVVQQSKEMGLLKNISIV